MTRALAIEYAKDGIRVNAVAPGIIKTPMHAPDTHEFLSALHPLGRMGEVHEIVDAILYLEKASFVTGETLSVDGANTPVAGRQLGITCPGTEVRPDQNVSDLRLR